MTTILTLETGRCEQVLDTLRAEYGAIMAARILEAEATDFLWETRVKERYLGQHFDVGMGSEGEDLELARVAILSILDGCWHVAACLVDGDAQAADLLWKRNFFSRGDAEAAFERAL